MISPSPASSDLVEHISAHSGSLPCSMRLAPYFLYSSMLPGTSVPPPPALRRAERAGVEAIPAADAQILGMEDDAVVGGENALHRADRRAGRVGAVHAGHGNRALARLAVIDGDDAPSVDAPRHLVLVLAGGDAGIALDAAVGIAEKLHPRHVVPPHAAMI